MYLGCRRASVVLVVALWLSSSVLADTTEESERCPQIVIPKAAAIPTIDGKRMSPEWNDAAEITGFVRHVGTGLFPTQTTVLLKYDAENLYVLTISKRVNDKPLRITRKHNADIFRDDSIEIHISTDGKRLLQLIGNSAGFTEYHSSQNLVNIKWACKPKYAASVQKGEWIGEWAIPLKELAAPAGSPMPTVGTRWRFNVADNRTTLGTDPNDWAGRSALANTGYNWEGVKHWAALEFGEKAARLTQIKFQNGRSAVDVQGSVLNESGRLQISVYQKNKLIKTVDGKAPAHKSGELRCKIDSIGENTVEVCVLSSDGKVLLRQLVPNVNVIGRLGLEVLTDPFNKKLLLKASAKAAKKSESVVAEVKDSQGNRLLVTRLKLVNKKKRNAVYDPALMGFVNTREILKRTGNKHYRKELGFDSFAVKDGFDVIMKVVDRQGNVKAKETMRVKTFPKPDWFANPVGMERDTVPSPWHPVLQWNAGKWKDHTGKSYDPDKGHFSHHPSGKEADRTAPADLKGQSIVRVWGRQFSWTNKPGELINSIESLGYSILASPMKLHGTMNGKPIEWESVHANEAFEGIDFVRRLTWKAGALTAEILCRVEYDGFVWFEVKLSGNSPSTIDTLYIDMPIESSVAELFNYRSMKPFPHSCEVGEVKNAGTMKFPFTGCLSFSNDRIGIGWVNTSMREWRPENPSEPLSLNTTGESAVFRVHLADKPVEVYNPWVIKFAVQPSPLKPWDRRYAFARIFEPVGYSWLKRKALMEEPLRANATVVNFHEHWSLWQDDGQPYNEAGLKELVKQVHDRGMKMTLYAGFGHSKMSEKFDFYRWPWVGEDLPDSVYIRRHRGQLERVYTTTKAPRAHWTDFMVSEIARWIDEYDVDGVFVDGMFYIETTDKGYWGRSYEAEESSDVREYCPLDARRYAERVYRVVKSRKPDGFINMSKGMEFPFYSGSFATNYSCGETMAILGKEKKAKPWEVIGTTAMRSVFGRQYGVPADVWGYNFALQSLMNPTQLCTMSYLHGVPLRAAGGKWFLDPVAPYWRQSDYLKDGEFIPFWKEGVPVLTEGANNVRVSAYRKGEGYALVVANVGSTKETVRLISKIGKRKWFSESTKTVWATSSEEIEIKLQSLGSNLILLLPPVE